LLPLTAITGIKENVEYTISNMDASGFKIRKVPSIALCR
jgi:hypothetical protein